MFNREIVNGLKTAGVFVLHKDKFAFMIGPDRMGKRYGIVRFGGHIEGRESVYECIERELKEEASVNVKIIDSPCVYYKKFWDDTNLYEVNEPLPLDIKPLIIVGNKERSTAVFLAYTDEELKPASETQGIIFLDEQDIEGVCSGKMLLRDFAVKGGRLIERTKLDLNMEIYAGPHLRFLYNLMNKNYGLIKGFINRELPWITAESR